MGRRTELMKKQLDCYRVQELQELLAAFRWSKTGPKKTLLERCLQLLKERKVDVALKMEEINKDIRFITTHLADRSYLHAVFDKPCRVGGYTHSGGGGSCSGTGNVVALAQPVQEQRRENVMMGHISGNQNGSVNAVGVRGGHPEERLPPIPIMPRARVYPHLKMRELPFLEVCSVLLEPTGLASQENELQQISHLPFMIDGRKVHEMLSYLKITPGPEQRYVLPLLSKLKGTFRIMLRFCAADSPEEEYKPDWFPPNMTLFVNNHPIPLPKLMPVNGSRTDVAAKRLSRPVPVDISDMVRWTMSNTVTVLWDNMENKRYAAHIYAAYQLTTEDLLERLKSKEELPEDFTKQLISHIASAEVEDNELCAPIKVSVACPMVKSRMELPCRSIACSHLPCFDGKSFLLMNEKKSKFICPVCNQLLQFDDLRIDGYFKNVLNQLPADAGDNIIVRPNGQWWPAKEEKKKQVSDGGPPRKRTKANDNENGIPTSDKNVIIIDLDDDDKMLSFEKETPSLPLSRSLSPDENRRSLNSGDVRAHVQLPNAKGMIHTITNSNVSSSTVPVDFRKRLSNRTEHHNRPIRVLDVIDIDILDA